MHFLGICKGIQQYINGFKDDYTMANWEKHTWMLKELALPFSLASEANIACFCSARSSSAEPLPV